MIIIDDTYSISRDSLRGRKPKFKLKKEKAEYIFKYGAINYEIWSELIAEQLGLQIGIDMAHYQLACYNGTYGVLTPSFVKSGELIISSDNLKKAIQFIFDENHLLSDLRDNSVVNLVQAAYAYDNRINSQELSFELMKRWCFYGLILESDKNATNIAFIKSVDCPLHLTPDYDNSSIASLNNDISHYMEAMHYGADIHCYTDLIQNDLKLTMNDTGKFLYDFRLFALKYPYQCEKIMTSFARINIDKAIGIVEEINQVSVPWNVSYWVNKVIIDRLQEMQLIWNKVRKEHKTLQKSLD